MEDSNMPNRFNFKMLCCKHLCNSESAFQYLQQLKIIPSEYTCRKCGTSMNRHVRADKGGLQTWLCSSRKCRSERSIAKGTIFESTKLGWDTATALMYLFVTGVQAYQCQILLEGEIDYRNILDWYSTFRKVMSHTNQKYPVRFAEETTLLNAEIDEALLGKKKK